MVRRFVVLIFSAFLAVAAVAHDKKAEGCEKCKSGGKCENCAKGVCEKCEKKEHCEKCAMKAAGCEKCKTGGKCENCAKGVCEKCDKKEHCEKCATKKAACTDCCMAAAPAGFKALFDGKSLKGWEQKNGTAVYSVVEGTIQGVTSEGSPNSFLCTTKDYDDFELRFEVKVDDALNSGVQIRSRSKADYNNGRVHGPQVEIATDGTAAYVYGEGLKHTGGWLSPQPRAKETHKLFKNGEWNSYVVRVEGERIITWLNGTQVTNIDDDSSGHAKGFIGLQVHGIKKGTGPYKVQWKNIYIKELKGNKEKHAKQI